MNKYKFSTKICSLLIHCNGTEDKQTIHIFFVYSICCDNYLLVHFTPKNNATSIKKIESLLPYFYICIFKRAKSMVHFFPIMCNNVTNSFLFISVSYSSGFHASVEEVEDTPPNEQLSTTASPFHINA